MFVKRRRWVNFELENGSIVLEWSRKLFNVVVVDVEGLLNEKSDGKCVGVSIRSEKEFVKTLRE
jgi:hypothetical protein